MSLPLSTAIMIAKTYNKNMYDFSWRAKKENKQQDDIASNDATATGIGLIIFLPALLFIDNDDLREEVAELKGRAEALEQASIQKKCGIIDGHSRKKTIRNTDYIPPSFPKS